MFGIGQDFNKSNINTGTGLNAPSTVSRLKEDNVPDAVKKTYLEEFLDYTEGNNKNWAAYPSLESDFDWYDPEPYIFTNNAPENFEIVHKKDDSFVRVIYSKEGKKIATHQPLKSDLPQGVSQSISRGKYKGWAVAKEKQGIFKETDKANMIYKVTISNGTEKHELFLQSDGKLIKDKKL
jgi:hypothetical protein